MNLTKFYTFRHFMPACLFSLFLFLGINVSQAQTTETFNYTGAVQNWTVPAGVTSIDIDARGAQGGGSFGGGGGLGARMTGTFSVTPGQDLQIVVGQMGLLQVGGNAQNSSGGGGGSFVYVDDNTLLVAAGGGGGKCNYTSSGPLHPGAAGQVTTSGGASSDGNAGGNAGSGGNAGLWSSVPCAGGGTGWLSAGGGPYGGSGYNTWTGGPGFCGGGGGGCGGVGGFGGGGGGGNHYGGGGGGGGYSGGGGGTDPTHGGGGGSYSAGTDQDNTAGFQSGDGQVIITYESCSDQVTFNYTGTIDSWEVPTGVTEITIEAYGAQGGNTNGGKGAKMQGSFSVTPGEVLNIVVGQQGIVNNCGGSNASGGGGGGSFVYLDDNTLLIAAGGGGGGNMNWSGGCINGIDAVITENGTQGNGASSAMGGINGNGGAGNAPSGTGSGGAGWFSNGQNSTWGGGSTGGQGPFSFAGGSGAATFGPGGEGGFGGGGGAVCGCGGGGGFSGGGGGEGSSCRAGGGGGGSFNEGANQNNTAGVQTGDGMVVISYPANCAPPCVDNDMDGYTDCDGDCDDNNPNLNPGASPAQSNVVYHNTSSATVYWTTIPGSTNYAVRYRLQGSSDPWTEFTSLRAWRRLYSLSPCTDYEVQYRNYKGGVWNCWSQNYFFSTGCAKSFNGGVKDGATSVATPQSFVQLFPNPTNGGDVTVEISTPASQNIEWTLTDLNGKTLQSGKANLFIGVNQITIQSAGLPAGVYFFKAPLADGMQVVKLVVQ